MPQASLVCFSRQVVVKWKLLPVAELLEK
jgi:hypothetical protein